MWSLLKKVKKVLMNERDNGTPDVVWQLNADAMRPAQTPWGFIVRNPIQRSLPPEASMEINLQVAANVPMIMFPTRSAQDFASLVAGTPMAILQPGEEVRVVIRNTSKQSSLVIDEKEGLVALYPLRFSGTTEVG